MIKKITLNCTTDDLDKVILKVADLIKDGYTVQELVPNPEGMSYGLHHSNYHRPTFDVTLGKVGD